MFVDDDPAVAGSVVNGSRCLSFDELLEGEIEATSVVVAIANSRVRELLARKCSSHGFKFFEVQAASHVRHDEIEIAEGAIFGTNTVITSNVRIGRHFHCNIYSYVAHDCVVGDFVTFAPRVSCNGRVVVKDHAYIGTGAMLKQGSHGSPLVIGEGSVVGMGAVVTRDVPPHTVVVGNPARPMR